MQFQPGRGNIAKRVVPGALLVAEWEMVVLCADLLAQREPLRNAESDIPLGDRTAVVHKLVQT